MICVKGKVEKKLRNTSIAGNYERLCLRVQLQKSRNKCMCVTLNYAGHMIDCLRNRKNQSSQKSKQKKEKSSETCLSIS